MKRLMHLNEDEKNLLIAIRHLSNKLTAGYSYRPNWDVPKDGNGEMYRDMDYKKLVQDENFVEIIDKINLCNCDTEFLEYLGFMRLDEEATAKGMRLCPLWYYEAINRGETKEKKLDTDTRFGCVFELVKVQEVFNNDFRSSN